MALKATRRKKKITDIPKGRIFIQSTFNNTIITLTDGQGNSLGWETAGHSGFRGARKSTPYAAQVAMRTIIDKAHAVKMTEVEIYVKGVGSGRESAVRALQGSGLAVTQIKDVTPIAHNGCRAKKPRRV
jgi:small subunit ribosomal protein S11